MLNMLDLYFRLCFDDVLKRLRIFFLDLRESIVLLAVRKERIVERVLLDEPIDLLLLLFLVDKCQCALVCRFEVIRLLALFSFPFPIL